MDSVRMKRYSDSLVSIVAGLVLLLAASAALAQEPPNPAQGFPDLVGGLKATPGCLGVETARTTSGKNVIFAWFENKKAVLNWYYSPMHQQIMRGSFEGASGRKPLQNVPDDSGPIMAIASITFSDKPHFEGVALPISQISIEMYAPVTGGLFLGGRFAPDALKVADMQDFTPPSQKKD